MANGFESKKKKVLSGNSKIFENWKANTSITVDDFLEALEWVCQDEFDEKHRCTREIGLEQDRIVKLKICRKDNKITGESFASYLPIDTDKQTKSACGGFSTWEGAVFADGFRRKIMLSARDSI